MYNIVILHLYTLWIDQHNKCSYHLSQCNIIKILLTIFPMLSLCLLVFYTCFTYPTQLPLWQPSVCSLIYESFLFSVFCSLYLSLFFFLFSFLESTLISWFIPFFWIYDFVIKQNWWWEGCCQSLAFVIEVFSFRSSCSFLSISP